MVTKREKGYKKIEKIQRVATKMALELREPHLCITATNPPEDVEERLEMEAQLAEALAADTIQESAISMTYKKCGSPCSVDEDLCYLCDRKQTTETEREGARRKQHNQPVKM